VWGARRRRVGGGAGAGGAWWVASVRPAGPPLSLPLRRLSRRRSARVRQQRPLLARRLVPLRPRGSAAQAQEWRGGRCGIGLRPGPRPPWPLEVRRRGRGGARFSRGSCGPPALRAPPAPYIYIHSYRSRYMEACGPPALRAPPAPYIYMHIYLDTGARGSPTLRAPPAPYIYMHIDLDTWRLAARPPCARCPRRIYTCI